ncbi:hypothetical protein [Asanoa iriomotensis]|uniref:hypothetical protein n=1 Tax=Asanoa iriomotensis TaxID=234613 RepID=UPI00194076C3|nr:hypothetical protein [Asanoa iriomotensis]
MAATNFQDLQPIAEHSGPARLIAFAEAERVPDLSLSGGPATSCRALNLLRQTLPHPI